MENTQFMQYGEEWRSEMKKLPKDVIINICSQIGIEKQKEIDKLKEAFKEIESNSACEHNFVSSVSYKGAKVCIKCNKYK